MLCFINEGNKAQQILPSNMIYKYNIVLNLIKIVKMKLI